MDDFEQRLKQQSLRQIPAKWREEILSAANAQTTRRLSPVNRHWLSTLNSQLSTLLWPHPKAWAGLAAIWAFIFILNFSTHDKTSVIAEKSATPSPEMIAELKQQRRMYAELIGMNDVHEADRQKIFLPRPRSECVEILSA